MTVAIGDLRRVFSIEEATDTPDGSGGYTRTWAPIGSAFGRLLPRRRKETVDDGRQVGVVTHQITIRWREGLSGSVRFVSNGVTYRLLALEAADPLERFLDCWCEEEQG